MDIGINWGHYSAQKRNKTTVKIKIMIKNKYNYLKVIQQNYGQGWEDVSKYKTNSTGNILELSGNFITLSNGFKREITLLSHNLQEYKLTGYPTRVIKRKEFIDKQ